VLVVGARSGQDVIRHLQWACTSYKGSSGGLHAWLVYKGSRKTMRKHAAVINGVFAAMQRLPIDEDGRQGTCRVRTSSRKR
jgi:hypothetical protein